MGFNSLTDQACLLILALTLTLLLPLSHTLSCTSQKFTNRLYQNCSDLPTLSSYLHWNYSAANSTLSIAFSAPPAKPEGWIAWAINPNATGMVGAQSLIAFKLNGTLVVKPYSLEGYGPTSIKQQNLSFPVTDLSAEESNGVITLFATVTVPSNTTSLNQVWQVGASVTTDGHPTRHDLQSANLDSKSTLQFASNEMASFPAPAPAPAPSTAPPPPSTGGGGGDEKSGVQSLIKRKDYWLG
ncbi:AIR12, DOMON domain [Dillenia turbinata]|uniref:AIR12, DOMON domain n=1 Tax=Dillenia turbinata TaxID=194707 RepID=A0AAN8VST8_9MAGN